MAQVSRAIAADETLADRYTWTSRLVVVVSDGTAVLGLGDIGPRASLPVMEGKSALFKQFAGLNSIPLVLDTKDPDEIVETLIRLRPSFGAVNLEDISAPRCFEIEKRVIEALDCPVMHDDQHGTAIVALAALKGAVKVQDRDITALRVVISGAGAAGVACANILLAAGIADVTVLDSKGIVSSDRADLNEIKADLAARTNPAGRTGGIVEALDGADVFLGVSAGTVPEEIIATMAPRRSSSRCPTRTRRSTRTSHASTPRSSRPAAATSRTRSTMCSPSPVCSRVRSTQAPAASPRA
ncbi:malic enzyme, NAD binding domain protein [Rhodococcus sp. MTM3W5.2]|nr:malic enzyme, NAD binding domain protein [Rhodococcus sp. MTM3W5.2]